MIDAILALAPSLITVLCSLIVAFFTARWQVRAANRAQVAQRRFELYDELVEILSELNLDPGRSLDDVFLSRLYALAGRVRAYASREVAGKVEAFADGLHERRARHDAAERELYGRWFEARPARPDDESCGETVDVPVRGQCWEYDAALAELEERDRIPPAEAHDVLIEMTELIRAEARKGKLR